MLGDQRRAGFSTFSLFSSLRREGRIEKRIGSLCCRCWANGACHRCRPRVEAGWTEGVQGWRMTVARRPGKLARTRTTAFCTVQGRGIVHFARSGPAGRAFCTVQGRSVLFLGRSCPLGHSITAPGESVLDSGRSASVLCRGRDTMARPRSRTDTGPGPSGSSRGARVPGRGPRAAQGSCRVEGPGQNARGATGKDEERWGAMRDDGEGRGPLLPPRAPGGRRLLAKISRTNFEF